MGLTNSVGCWKSTIHLKVKQYIRTANVGCYEEFTEGTMVGSGTHGDYILKDFTSPRHFRLVHPHQQILRLDSQVHWRGGGMH